MKVHAKLPMLIATIALGITPALAVAAAPAAHTKSPHGNHGVGHKPTSPGPGASRAAKAKAYGKYCRGESKTHVAGTRGTPFSKCVTDMAKLAHGSTKSPRIACKDESKKHVAHTAGTPFSRCVSGGRKLLKTKHARH
jgi:hypothetical protein